MNTSFCVFIFNEHEYSGIFVIMLKMVATHQLTCPTQLSEKRLKVLFPKIGNNRQTG